VIILFISNPPNVQNAVRRSIDLWLRIGRIDDGHIVHLSSLCNKEHADYRLELLRERRLCVLDVSPVSDVMAARMIAE